MSYPKLLEKLIESFTSLPGVGRRSAERMALWIMNNPPEHARRMAQNLVDLKENLKFCKICSNFSDKETCHICCDPSRDKHTICVVEDPKDLIAIERTGTFRGHYHVLLGAIAPTQGRGPDDLKLDQLIERIARQSVKEVVIATDPDTEGEMTALHLFKELRVTGVKISRIGLGIPVGSAVEYADLSTLTMSLTARREM